MTIAPEFSRPIPIDTIGAGAVEHEIRASPEECAALAKRFGLKAIASLVARADVRREGAQIFADGDVRAEVTQSCVVTDEPIAHSVSEDFSLRFVPEDAPKDEEEIELSADECETLSYEGGAIDLGEAAAETVALTLDPFPRGPNADDALRDAGVISEEEAGPFGALKDLRDQLAAKKD
jgi:uncharacterized metal-binding protein YceD (DUF177 family)